MLEFMCLMHLMGNSFVCIFKDNACVDLHKRDI